MGILSLVLSPDPRLKQKSARVAKVDDSIRQLLRDMLETMYEHNGVGLAAVQVGVHKRVMVVDVAYGGKRKKGEEQPRNPLCIVNPEIVWESEDDAPYDEGCLSFPGEYAEVVRPARIKLKYLDENGEIRHLEADGLLATCIQHEMDHLDGVTFVDHISRLKRDMILRKMKKAAKYREAE
jgi:peptide deformylase